MECDLARFLPLLTFLARRQKIPRGCLLEQDDLVSEAYAALLVGIHRFDPRRGGLTGFVVAVGHGAMRDAIRYSMRVRGSGRSAHKRVIPQSFEDVAAPPPAPTEDLPLRLTVQEALGLLPPQRRDVVTQHWMEGRSARALAQEAHRSEDWAYRELWLAKPVLRMMLQSSVA